MTTRSASGRFGRVRAGLTFRQGAPAESSNGRRCPTLTAPSRYQGAPTLSGLSTRKSSDAAGLRLRVRRALAGSMTCRLPSCP